MRAYNLGPPYLNLHELPPKLSEQTRRLQKLLVSSARVSRSPVFLTTTPLTVQLAQNTNTTIGWASLPWSLTSEWRLPSFLEFQLTYMYSLDEPFSGSAYAWEALAAPKNVRSGNPSARAMNTTDTLWQFHERAEESSQHRRFNIGMKGIQALQPANAILTGSFT
jgi:hypothetical protein